MPLANRMQRSWIRLVASGLLGLSAVACGSSLSSAEAEWCSSHASAVAATAQQLAIPLPAAFTIYGGAGAVSGADRLASLRSETPVWIQASFDDRSMASIAAGLAAERPADYARACQVAAAPPSAFEAAASLTPGVAVVVAFYLAAAAGSAVVAARRGQRPAEVLLVVVLSVVAGPLGWWAATRGPVPVERRA